MQIITEIRSTDKMAIKFVQQTDDGYVIKTLYVNRPEKHIICYSTQVGCGNGCTFCHTGIFGKFIRNLTSKEIVEQCENVINAVGIMTTCTASSRILFSAMGVGEPLNNYDGYVSSMFILDRLYKPWAKFALATCGSNRYNIIKLAGRVKSTGIKLKLTLSVHSANPVIRRRLIPASDNLDLLLQACKDFHEISGMDVEYNVTLIDYVNDSDIDADKLIELFLRHNMPTAAIKINRFNEVHGCDYRPSCRVSCFIDRLKRYSNMSVEYYETNGSDINGACGQMTTRKI